MKRLRVAGQDDPRWTANQSIAFFSRTPSRAESSMAMWALGALLVVIAVLVTYN